MLSSSLSLYHAVKKRNLEFNLSTTSDDNKVMISHHEIAFFYEILLTILER